jgi:hypothetical protein
MKSMIQCVFLLALCAGSVFANSNGWLRLGGISVATCRVDHAEGLLIGPGTNITQYLNAGPLVNMAVRPYLSTNDGPTEYTPLYIGHSLVIHVTTQKLYVA